MNLLLVLGLVLASAMALPTKNKPPVRKPHHDAHRVGHHHDVKGLIKGVLNSKIKGLINEPLIPWIQSNTLDSFKGKMRQLKQKNAGKVKSRRQGKIPEFKNIFGWTNEKDDKEAPRIEDLVDPDLADILYGGDILLNPDQVDALLAEPDTRKKRQATTVWNKWTNPVNYYFDPVAGYTDAQKTIMRNAFKVWDDNTCINFAETSTPANKIKVTNTLGSGCYATLGMQSNGQVMSLPGGCINPGTAAHEMCHALGVFHHQARSDRDNYIYVNTSNILSDDESQAQYDKLSTSESNNFNTLYDYGSVMHYSDSGFTNGNGPTMIALNPMHQKTMGQRDGPSFIDILLVNRFYNCLGTCASLACQNGGYPNPANCAKCICPSGFSGTLCDQRPASTNTAACTGSTLTATTSFQTLTVSLDREFEEGLTTDSCTYWINSPAGTQIEIQFVQMEKYASCGLTSLEVKAEDMTLTGYKICPTANGVQSLSNIPVIKSTTNKVILTLRNAWGTFNTNLKYRYVAGTGGATQPPATTTTTTEAPTGGCTDIDTDCDYFNSQGYCSTDSIYYQWMTENCAQTCDTCNTCTNDADDADCDAWAANGDCDWDQFMWDYCKKSCNLC